VINNVDSTLSLTSCKHVSVDELDEWFHSKQWNEIPKIIHQTWKNKTLRKRQAQWSETWCKQYIGWRYHLWTDDENEVFVRTKFPWFYPTYKRLSPAILRVDSVRYLYMLYYGGLYVRFEYL
jgi:mannosyltransferase OCH1-like enzyme